MEHPVDKVAKCAGQHLGILCKAKRLLNAEGLATLYKTRVRSVMEYCGPIWQNASKTALHKLDNIQRKACRSMGKHCDVIPELNLSSLQHRRDISALCQVHRMISGTAPPSVLELLPKFAVQVKMSQQVTQHHYYQLHIECSKTEHHKNSLIPRYARCWNSLPVDCIYNQNGELNNLQSFKAKTNRWLLTCNIK